MKAVLKVGAALVAIALTGCVQQAIIEPPVEEPVVKAEPVEPPELPPRPFTSDTFYALLSAEIAGSRGRFDVALANYAQQAEQTRDPKVAERAFRIARYLGDKETAQRTAAIWAEAAPDNQDAQASAILALIEADRLMEAFNITKRGTTRDSGSLYQSIAANAQQVTDTQREQLLEQYQLLLTEEPTNISLLIGTGLLLQQQQRPEQALALANQALALEPNNTHALVLASGLMHQQKRNAEALALIEGKLASDPDNTRLRLQYARLLTFTDLETAQSEFQQLVDTNPQDADMLHALALVAEQRGDLLTAERSYYALLELGKDSNAAHFFLGKLAESRDQPDEALKQYSRVRLGDEFAAANAQILAIYLAQGQAASAANHYQRMLNYVPDEQRDQLTLIYQQRLIEAERPDEALKVLNEPLTAEPQNSDLLYSRAMLHEQLGNHELAEQDLRTIVEYDPNNATALNALGYILTENTERYSEAYELIKQALELQPDDPATIDSLGWVHYRLGNLEIAIRYLRKAIHIYPDHEIAAHLGEALWVNSQRDEAKSIWSQGLELHPESPYILETLERLDVPRDALAEPDPQ
ncbi:tetratricopeptide repeat protein [Gilvimarinus sp. SDUM040013]|uniref:Tetratricopeptide repeat protein n=1 Tax=Gilvimarinus gilvus TaxID=3058038 RepID=A0ABU4S3K6_9GAMM|nr:tetratricopeptide repeat protein [Gilvimarinus sp. SDUM040013]MDO3386071.1 tetratricopeptide repeat protein [Gilvimarinus sp. SDUM040013]MDX6850388.1 tetratricopeptide repeat protein [Gilvimarinus sp. SDUM040013]